MMQIFDRTRVAQHYQRARQQSTPVDFLWKHCGGLLQESLLDIKRDFDTVVENSAGCYVLTPAFLQQKKIASPLFAASLARQDPVQDCVLDDEVIPFAPHSLDAYISMGQVQWLNDVPGFLVQMRQALRPDGLLIGSFFGGDTLVELRSVLSEAEMMLYGGMAPRVSPMIGLQDMAALMQRAQFALPVVDHDMITITYANVRALVADIRGMGQSHALAKRHTAWRGKTFWNLVEELYRRDHAHADGRLRVTVEVISFLGWAPDASQPQPLARGSATHSLVDVLQKPSR